MSTGSIPYRNQNYLRTTKDPVKGHLVAEDFDAVQNTVTSHDQRIALLESKIAALLAAQKGK